ncbi:hypothetical protein HY522_04835 [bacterium]|nr:hypothetical protein [bacterium]
MVVRPIDVQVIVAQQTQVAGTEQAQQNLAPLVQSKEMQKIPDKTHERETQVAESGETDDIKVREREQEKRERGKKKSGGEEEGEEEEKGARGAKEDGKGERFDATT